MTSSMYPTDTVPVATLPETDRATFLGRVYQHLALALAAFVVFEILLFFVGAAEWMYDTLAGSSGGWLLILGGFMVATWIATNAAHDVLNPSRQYAGLFGIAAAEALIFAPFLYYVFTVRSNGTSVWAAAVITGVGFAVLTAVGLFTSRDLSYLRPILLWGFGLALVAIVGALLFGFNLGVWFSVAMIGLAGVAILYSTQNILRHYPADAYVGAAVQLFASLMTMFWYVLRLLNRN